MQKQKLQSLPTKANYAFTSTPCAPFAAVGREKRKQLPTPCTGFVMVWERTHVGALFVSLLAFFSFLILHALHFMSPLQANESVIGARSRETTKSILNSHLEKPKHPWPFGKMLPPPLLFLFSPSSKKRRGGKYRKEEDRFSQSSPFYCAIKQALGNKNNFLW